MATFPIAFMPDVDYHFGLASFGNDRGDILHPACDLKAPKGTEIYAVEWGIVVPIAHHVPIAFFESGPHIRDPNDARKWICAPGATCLMVYELIVQHRTFIARYGEIAANVPDDIQPGAEVQEGQLIAYVGAQSVATMLHFEMYSNPNDVSYPTVFNNMDYINLPRPRITYHRRSDLMDPTSYLDSCSMRPPEEDDRTEDPDYLRRIR